MFGGAGPAATTGMMGGGMLGGAAASPAPAPAAGGIGGGLFGGGMAPFPAPAAAPAASAGFGNMGGGFGLGVSAAPPAPPAPAPAFGGMGGGGGGGLFANKGLGGGLGGPGGAPGLAPGGFKPQMMAAPPPPAKIVKDEQLAKFASKLKLNNPTPGAWMSMFQQLCDQLQTAVVISDMKMPGIPVVYANPAACALTGYPADQMINRNCRFLQGRRTEGAAVRQMTNAIRNAKGVTVKVTNYKKDGTEFGLILSLNPVHDSTGEYRYSIGLQADAAKFKSESATFEKIKALLPTTFEAAAQPKKFDDSLKKVDMEAQRKQWASSIQKFTRLVWSMDWELTLKQFMGHKQTLQAFYEFLKKAAPNEALQLELCMKAGELEKLPPSDQDGAALEMYRAFMGSDPADPTAAFEMIMEQKKQALNVIAIEALPKFVQSKACVPVVEKMTAAAQNKMMKSDDLLWSEYQVPEDVAGWLYAFISVAMTYPACIVISDMTIPGNPMCFVNTEFCRITGYDLREVQGRNCRFLQGPRTEPASVAVIQDTLRRGVDCHVKITNYRKNGENFQNLLTMRPVHDSNGVYRYCIGVQFEITPNDPKLKSRLAKLDKLIQLLPKTFDVSSRAVGQKFTVEEADAEKKASTEEKLMNALEGATEVYTEEKLEDGDHYADHYADHLAHCAKVSGLKTDEQLEAMAKKLSLKASPPGPWLAMFTQLADQIDTAIVVTDMKTPGLPVTYVNKACVKLTGFTESEFVGRNCRFLQGRRTEGAAVRAMTSAIRKADELLVKVTNYRKDKSEFALMLALHPVHDSTGEYRYVIGLQCDATKWSAEQANFEKIRKCLPSHFEAAAQATKFDETLSKVDIEAQRKQWAASLQKFTRLVWSMEWETTLDQFMNEPMAAEAFYNYLKKSSPNEALQLELCMRTRVLESMGPDEKANGALQLCAQYLGIQANDPNAAFSALTAQYQQALSVLAMESLPKFVQSKACLPIVEQLTAGSTDNIQRADGLLWSDYKVPDDVAGWLYSFVSVAMTYPACIVISDMAIPGNPMCFVNHEFCRITGYDLREVHGRNCRFLQGPKTEPASVAVIQDTLRRGVDCHVKITNYRKNGELFQNLLTMRPVHDSNGVYRYCIGVQFEVTPNDPKLKNRLAKLDKLIQLLPKTFEVSSQAVGMTHKRDEVAQEQTMSIEEKIQNALQGATDVYTDEKLEDGDYYADHYKDHLEHCAKVAQAGHALSYAAPVKMPDAGKVGVGGKKGGAFGATRVAPKG